jgi:hypothetical protein
MNFDMTKGGFMIWIELIGLIAFVVMGFIGIKLCNSRRKEYFWLRDRVELPESSLEEYRFNLEFLRICTISSFIWAISMIGVLISRIFQL